MPDDRFDAPKEAVGIPYSLFQSFLGMYYIGRTPGLFIRGNCWGGIINPRDSDADIFIDSISVSNTCASPVCTRVWVNSPALGSVYVTPYVTQSNTAAEPPRCPRGVFSYAQDLKTTLQEGCSLASRFIAPLETQTQEFGGKLIIPPLGSCMVFCYARESAKPGQSAGQPQTCEISMQWWEQQIAV